MDKKPKGNPNNFALNPLFSTTALLQDMPRVFKTTVCAECGWSEATYYRKSKTKKISNAEKDKILSIAEGFAGKINDICQHLRTTSYSNG